MVLASLAQIPGWQVHLLRVRAVLYIRGQIMTDVFVDELLALVEDCMDRALDAYPDSAKIDVLWAGMKEIRERLRGQDDTRRD